MASNLFTAVLAATTLILLSTSAYGQEDRHGVIGGYGEHSGHGGYGGHGGRPGHPKPCFADPREVDCLNFNLELLLKIAVADYIKRNPSITSPAPWFDPSKHVDVLPGSLDDISLSLLGSEEVRESLLYCVVSYDNRTTTYAPTSPTQMYDDLCTQNHLIWSELK